MAAMGFDMRTTVVASFKFRWRALAVFCFFVGLAVLACLVMRTQYSATASMVVKIGRELVYRPDVGDTQAAIPTVDHDETMASIITIMQSRSIAEQVINTIGLAQMYPELVPDPSAPESAFAKLAETVANGISAITGTPPEAPMTTAVRHFQRKLDILVVKRTGIVTVEFTHPNPEIAARAANLVVELFQKQAGAIYDDPNLAFMQQLVDRERAAQDSAQAALDAFERKYGVYALDAQVTALLGQKTAIDSNMKTDAAHMAELQILVHTLETQLASVPQRVVTFSDSVRNRAVDDTEQQLLTLRITERQMATQFAANYPPLVQVRNQIAVAEQALKSARTEPNGQPRTGLNDTYALVQQNYLQRQAELASLVGRQQAMKAQLASIDQSLSELSDRQRELAALQQDVALRADAVRTSYDKLAEARAVDGLNRQKPSSFSVYEAAQVPDLANPSRPQPVLYTLVGVIFGMLAAVTTVFLSYALNGTFLTPELAGQRLGVPVLGVVDYRRSLARLGHTALLSAPMATVGQRS